MVLVKISLQKQRPRLFIKGMQFHYAYSINIWRIRHLHIQAIFKASMSLLSGISLLKNGEIPFYLLLLQKCLIFP